jgi:hypothetical protein
MREFRLFEHRSGAYELLVRGWSFWALMFHMFWAIGNGVFPRFAKFFLPACLVMGVGLLLLDIEEYELVAMIIVDLSILFVTGFVVYFSMVATRWRAELLVKNGYKLVATIRAWSGQQALKKWALSKKADEVAAHSQ